MLVEIILKFFLTQLFYLIGCQLLFSQLLIPVPTPPMDSSRWWLSSFCSVGLVGSLQRSGSVLHLIQVLVRVAFQVTPNLQFKTRSNTMSCRPRQSSADQHPGPLKQPEPCTTKRVQHAQVQFFGFTSLTRAIRIRSYMKAVINWLSSPRVSLLVHVNGVEGNI